METLASASRIVAARVPQMWWNQDQLIRMTIDVATEFEDYVRGESSSRTVVDEIQGFHRDAGT